MLDMGHRDNKNWHFKSKELFVISFVQWGSHRVGRVGSCPPNNFDILGKIKKIVGFAHPIIFSQYVLPTHSQNHDYRLGFVLRLQDLKRLQDFTTPKTIDDCKTLQGYRNLQDC